MRRQTVLYRWFSGVGELFVSVRRLNSTRVIRVARVTMECTT